MMKAKDIKDKLTENTSTAITVRLPNECVELLKNLAKNDNVNVSTKLRQVILTYLLPLNPDVVTLNPKSKDIIDCLSTLKQFKTFYESLRPIYNTVISDENKVHEMIRDHEKHLRNSLSGETESSIQISLL